MVVAIMVVTLAAVAVMAAVMRVITGVMVVHGDDIAPHLGIGRTINLDASVIVLDRIVLHARVIAVGQTDTDVAGIVIVAIVMVATVVTVITVMVAAITTHATQRHHRV